MKPINSYLFAHILVCFALPLSFLNCTSKGAKGQTPTIIATAVQCSDGASGLDIIISNSTKYNAEFREYINFDNYSGDNINLTQQASIYCRSGQNSWINTEPIILVKSSNLRVTLTCQVNDGNAVSNENITQYDCMVGLGQPLECYVFPLVESFDIGLPGPTISTIMCATSITGLALQSASELVATLCGSGSAPGSGCRTSNQFKDLHEIR